MEPAEQRSFRAAEAADFVRGFNLAMLSNAGRLWAVAVPVSIRYEGDLSADSRIADRQLAKFSTGARRQPG